MQGCFFCWLIGNLCYTALGESLVASIALKLSLVLYLSLDFHLMQVPYKFHSTQPQGCMGIATTKLLKFKIAYDLHHSFEQLHYIKCAKNVFIELAQLSEHVVICTITCVPLRPKQIICLMSLGAYCKMLYVIMEHNFPSKIIVQLACLSVKKDCGYYGSINCSVI